MNIAALEVTVLFKCRPKQKALTLVGKRKQQQALKFFASAVALLVICAPLLAHADTMQATSSNLTAATATSPDNGNVADIANMEVLLWNSQKEDEIWRMESTLARLIQIKPQDAYAHYLYTLLRLKLFSFEPTDLSQLKTASELAQQAIELGPELEYGYIGLASVLDAMGHSEKGTEVLRSYQSQYPNITWRLPFSLARLEAERVSTSDIIAYLDQSIADCGNQVSVVAPYLIATLDVEFEGNEALTEVSIRNQNCPNKFFEMTLAERFLSLKNYEQAQKHFTNALKMDPNSVTALINYSYLQYEGRKNYRMAHQHLAKAIALSEQQGLMREASKAYLHLGTLYARQGHHDAALDAFLMSGHRASDSASCVEYATKVLRKTAPLVHLDRFYSRWLSDIGGDSLVFALQAELYSSDLDLDDMAVDSFEKAIIMDPSRPEYYNGLGLVHYRAQRLDSALAAFQLAGKISPSDSIARYNEACILAKLGHNEQAIPKLREAFDLNPALRQTAQQDSDLATLRNDQEFISIVNQTSPQLSVEELDEDLGH